MLNKHKRLKKLDIKNDMSPTDKVGLIIFLIRTVKEVYTMIDNYRQERKKRKQEKKQNENIT